jgi:hypothetical protein
MLWGMLVATHRQEICSGQINIYSVAYWAIPYMWALLVVGLAVTVNDLRRRHFSLCLSAMPTMVFCIYLNSKLNKTCG